MSVRTLIELKFSGNIQGASIKTGISESDVCQILIFCHITLHEPIFKLYQSVEPITIDQSGLRFQMVLLDIHEVEKPGSKINKNWPIFSSSTLKWLKFVLLIKIHYFPHLACHEVYKMVSHIG